MIRTFELAVILGVSMLAVAAALYAAVGETPSNIPPAREIQMDAGQILSKLLSSGDFYEALYRYVCLGDDGMLRALLRAVAPPGGIIALEVEIDPANRPLCLACRNATLEPVIEPFNVTPSGYVSSIEMVMPFLERAEARGVLGDVSVPVPSVVRVRIAVASISP